MSWLQVSLRLAPPVLLLAGCGAHGALRLPAHSVQADRLLGPGVNGRVIVEPRDGDWSLVRVLNKASASIFVETYILSSRTVVHALERAASQSVDVHVLLERHPLGMGRQPETVASELRAAGVAVRWSDPSFILTHSKAMVVDDRLALVSTANFSQAGFTGDRDFMIWDSSRPDVNAVDTVLRHDWNRSSAVVHAPELVIAPSSARFKLETLVRTASSAVDIYGEEMRDRHLQRVLSAEACRGVNVRVILPAAPPAGSAIFRGGCVQLRVLTHPYVHAKVILVDRRRGYLGSENFSAQSLDQNREIGVLVRGHAVRTIGRVFERDWRRGLPVHLRGS